MARATTLGPLSALTHVRAWTTEPNASDLEQTIEGQRTWSMARFSDLFGINKTQPELDFVDIDLDTDMPLFIDPFAIKQRPDPWSQTCTHTLVEFFQHVVDNIRAGNEYEAKKLLS